MAGGNLGRQQSGAGNRVDIQAVLERHQDRLLPGLERLDFRIVPGIHLGDRRLFLDEFRNQVPQLREAGPERFLHLGGDEDPGRFLPPDGHAVDHGLLAASFGEAERVVGKLGVGVETALGPFLQILHQGPPNRNFVDAVLRQADPDGVAQPVQQERTDSDSALDPPIFPIARLGHAKVQRVVPVRPLLVERGNQQTVGLNHHLRIRRLHREDEVVKVHLPGDPGKFQGALHHSVRRVPVPVHDPIGQRTVVGADAQGELALLQQLHQRGEGFLDPGQLLGVLIIGIFADGKFLFVGEVPGVDADLVDPLGRLHGGIGLEMDVRHDRHVATGGEQLLLDVFEVGGVLHRGGGDPDDLAPHLDEIEGLLHRGGRVHGVAGDHALDHDGVGSPDADLPHLHLPGRAAGVAVRTGTIAGHFFSVAGRNTGISVDSAGLSIRRLILRESW